MASFDFYVPHRHPLVPLAPSLGSHSNLASKYTAREDPDSEKVPGRKAWSRTLISAVQTLYRNPRTRSRPGQPVSARRSGHSFSFSNRVGCSREPSQRLASIFVFLSARVSLVSLLGLGQFVTEVAIA